MAYEKDRLISIQQLEIQRLKDENKDMDERLLKIYQNIFSCGGPLNDNIDRYTNPQMKRFYDIAVLTGYY